MAGGKSVAAWTLDERLASRCNRVKADERVRGEQATAQMRTQSLFAGNPADIISGRSHPELFLPHELFEEVVTGAVFDPGFQLVFRTRVKAAGLPLDFWRRLETLSATYVADLREQRKRASDKSAAGRAFAIAGRASLELQTCRDRALALRKARATFGSALDTFMYEYVAPGRTDYHDEVSDERVLRSREGGCP